jgi:DNA polymerase kappa
MFFAAVEQMHRPELAHVPFAIGGLGMISTANSLARKYHRDVL